MRAVAAASDSIRFCSVDVVGIGVVRSLRRKLAGQQNSKNTVFVLHRSADHRRIQRPSPTVY